MKARAFLLSMLILGGASTATFPQDAVSGVVVLKFSWEKVRISPISSVASLASQDELIQQSKSQQQLSSARNSANKGVASGIQTQLNNRDQAVANARQTPDSRYGYRYNLTLRNEGGKKVKSIDWDYVFLDPITQEEVARHQFTSDETIKPGKSKEFGVLYLVPPVKTVSARTLNEKDPMPFTELVVVVRIKYSDGSVWQHH